MKVMTGSDNKGIGNEGLTQEQWRLLNTTFRVNHGLPHQIQQTLDTFFRTYPELNTQDLYIRLAKTLYDKTHSR